MTTLLFSYLLNPTLLSAQRIQFEPDLPEPPVEEPLTLPAPPTSCETFGGLNFMDAIGSGAAGPNPIQLASQLIGSGSNIFNNVNFHVKGKFTIDATILFYRCKFKMEEGSEIIVKSHLRSRATHYFACNGMWKGIKAEDAGKISLDGNGSIEDAITAVDVTEKCKGLGIDNTTFNRNMQGIFLHSTTANPSTIIFSRFYNNRFTCTSELNGSSGWTQRGIYASVVNVPNLGAVPFVTAPPTAAKDYANVFSGNIGTGIKSYNSLLNIQYCRFANIDKSIDGRSHGISAYNSNITLTGLGTPYLDLSGVGGSGSPNVPEEETTFYNCRDGGITTNSSHLSVKNSFFYFKSDLSKNIKSIINCLENPYGERIDITGNHFYVEESILNINLIDISRSSAQLTILNNEIVGIFDKNESNARIGIHIVSGHSSKNSSSSVLIEHNLVALQSTASGFGTKNSEGIKLEGGSGYFILNNKMPSHGKKMNIGINAIDIQLPSEIKNNYIQFSTIGIRLFSSLQQFLAPTPPDGAAPAPGAIKVCDNELMACDKGTLFLGGHSLVLANNHYYENKKALALENVPIPNVRIGKQWNGTLFRKNYFERDLGTSTTNNSAEMPNNGSPKLSQFGIDTRVSSTMAGLEYSKVAFENIVPITVQKTWFSDEPVTQDVGCEIITAAAVAWENLDDAILAGTYSNQSLALRQEVDSYLFDKLTKYPELLIGYPEQEAFFNEKQQTNVPIFNQLRKSIDHVFEYSSEHQTQLNILQTQLNTQKANWIDLIKTYNAEFGENEWSEVALNTIQILSNNIAAIQVDIASITAQINEAAINRIEALIALNATVVPQSPHEIYTKNANYYWLKMLLTKNHLNSDELIGVREIAATCYKDAGRAKYIAINTLAESETEGYINNACQIEGRIAYNPKGHSTMEVKIMPNPANEMLNIETNNNNNILNPCIGLSLVDISGKVIKQMENTNQDNSFLMETQDLYNGIYFLHLKYKDNSMQSHKVVVLH